MSSTLEQLDFALGLERQRYSMVKEAQQKIGTVCTLLRERSNIVLARFLFIWIGKGKTGRTIHEEVVFPRDASDECMPQILGELLASLGDEARDVNSNNDDLLLDMTKQIALRAMCNDFVDRMEAWRKSPSSKLQRFRVQIQRGIGKHKDGNLLSLLDAETNMPVTGVPKVFVYTALLEKLVNTCKATEQQEIEKCVFLVLFRYLHVLDSGGHQLALMYDKHKELFGGPVQCEGFGSPLNRTQQQFCGAFPDVDSLFKGHVGRFEDLVFEAGKIYTVNPPYDGEVMGKASAKVVRQLEACPPGVQVFVTIPIWDYEGMLQAYPEEKHVLFEKYKGVPYPALDVLKASPFVREVLIFKRDELPYWDSLN